MAAPFAPRIDGDRLYGRGAYDMKAGLAAALIACRDAAELDLAGDVVVAAVADEEHASIGVQEILGAVRADAAIVTEPTEMRSRRAPWLRVVRVEVTGRAAHGSRPHLGVDAIVKTGPVLTALGALDGALDERRHPLLGRGSVHASLISGGEELSSYPAQCVVGIERRTLPGETVADVEAELERCSTVPRGRPGSRGGTADAARARAVRDRADAPSWGGRGRRRRSARVPRSRARATGPTPRSSPRRASRRSCSARAARAPTRVEEWVSLADTEVVARTLVHVAKRLCA